MNLYFSPGACSMVPHIVLEELGMKYESIPVDLKAHTYGGGDFYKVNPKGYVPVLELDNKQTVTENLVILQYLADLKPEAKLLPLGGMERVRHLETLTFITTELHKSFGALFNPKTPDEVKASTKEHIQRRYEIVEKQLEGKDYLMGNSFALPDAYLFVMTRWGKGMKVGLEKFPNVLKHFDRVNERPAVKKVIAAEGGKK